nr:A/G-specific adenine glycosylase [Chitinophagaceae bacterium]
MNYQLFSKLLLHWDRHQNDRSMPWKGEKNPYKIWVSEIILQQTRVQQGEKYYRALLKKYPDIAALANANESELYKIWQGLGYYSRCKNMLQTAKMIVNDYNGIFPHSYDDILKLKGIGPYTAAAIAAFAFDLPYAVVDGNVIRILSRYFGIESPYQSAKEKKQFELLAQKLLPKKQSASYNQAIMDLGATICKPQSPLCESCPFAKKCYAYIHGRISELPAKKSKIILKDRYFHFFIFENKQSIFIQQRNEKDIWQHLYSPYRIEKQKINLTEYPFLQGLKYSKIPERYTQKLSHQKIHGFFYRMEVNNLDCIQDLQLIKIPKARLSTYAFPKMIISFFEKNNYL